MAHQVQKMLACRFPSCVLDDYSALYFGRKGLIDSHRDRAYPNSVPVLALQDDLSTSSDGVGFEVILCASGIQ